MVGAFEDKFTPLQKKGEVRVGKLILLDNMIRAIINSAVVEKDPISTTLALSFFIKSLAGGSSRTEKWEEVNKEVDELFRKAVTSKINDGVTMYEVTQIFAKIMDYANSEHNYMFIRRTEVAEAEEEERQIEGE